MKHIKGSIPTSQQLLIIIFITLLMVSCNSNKPKDTTYNDVHIEPEKKVDTSISSLVGEWKLDSVVFINDNSRGKQQIPISTTTWSFTDKDQYTVKIQQNQLDLTIEEDSVQQKLSFTTEIPSSKMVGRYKHTNQELITNILGGNTKYTITKQSDNQLQLSSLRMQAPPISKEDEGKLAEHYFTMIQND